ncbi:Endoribonuclease YbeY [bacterium HR33]|nr:Endoribonuclease YbeY [bacterium HR33]
MGSRSRGNQIAVASAGVRVPLGAKLLRQIVEAVLEKERKSGAMVNLTFLSAGRMRSLHRRAFGRSSLTDVIAFSLAHGGTVVGDIYICPQVARKNAKELGVRFREEIVRLVVHGTLHVLGYDHPEGEARQRSPMWLRQERYVRSLAS